MLNFVSYFLAWVAIFGLTLGQDYGATNQAPSVSAHHRARHSKGHHKSNGSDASPSTFITKQKAGSSDAALQPYTSNGVLYQPVLVTTTPSAPVQVSTQAPPADSKTQSVGSAPSSSNSQSSDSISSLNPQVLTKVMPSSSSCSGAKTECITAADAAPLIVQSYSKYKITSKGAQAAILALIAVESGELKYNQRYTDGLAAPALTGQGTRNMMSPAFVLEYGKALYGAAAGSDAVTVMNKINSNQADSMASAAWFLATKCPSVLQQFASSPDAAYTQYITSCIGTTMADQRQKYWNSAKAALGV